MYVPDVGQRVRRICSGQLGTVDEVYRADGGKGHWMVNLTLDNGVTMTVWALDFGNNFGPAVSAKIINFAERVAEMKSNIVVTSVSEGEF